MERATLEIFTIQSDTRRFTFVRNSGVNVGVVDWIDESSDLIANRLRCAYSLDNPNLSIRFVNYHFSVRVSEREFDRIIGEAKVLRNYRNCNEVIGA